MKKEKTEIMCCSSQERLRASQECLRASTEAASPQPGANGSLPRRVLVAEDDPDVAMLIRLHLEREGWEVLMAEHGLQALDHIRAGRPDLLITDVMMPQMNGFELIASLLRDPSLTDLPIIVLTGKAIEDADVRQAHEMGVFVYLTKPFQADELVVLARRMMGDAPGV